MAAGDVLLSVQDVWQKLGDAQILQTLSFEVRDRVRPGVVTGQVVGMLGPSGVGKTRLLRLIAGLDDPDRGSIRGPGGAVLPVGSVGVVFQSYPLLAHRTVLDNLTVAGETNGLSNKESRTKSLALLERFRLSERAHYFPAQLSGGQRQRVAIAQQLVKQKTFLLMDEPFSGLDPAALEDVTKLIIEVANMDELNTVLLVTHDIRSALLISDTLFMLGRDRDAKGQVTSGARIQKTYDLVEMGLAWRPELELDPNFPAVEREVKQTFKVL
jgi:polar amino acid transport system ATP-binding protein/sulfate transport system ATP-binding protein